jgi:GNAT superfamily N-acetyltransferase
MMRECRRIIHPGATICSAMRASPYPHVDVMRASGGDADLVLDILEEAARWLSARGIEQWSSPLRLRRRVMEAFEHGDSYLAWDGGRAVGTLSLQTTDVPFWGERPPDALYLHRLAVRRSHPGLGRWLIEWAEEAARAAGKAYVRLDCMAGNPGIRELYERAGYRHRGDVDRVAGWLASLYEKRVVAG